MRTSAYRTCTRLVALALLLAAVPATARAADTASSARLTTRLALTAPAICGYGASVRATATLRRYDDTPLSNRRVVISRVGDDPAVLADATTDAAGRVSVTLAPVRKVSIQATFPGTRYLAPSLSATATTKPHAKLARPWTHSAYAYPGQRLPARGRVWPKHSEANDSTIIYCDRWEDGKWVTREKYRAKIVNDGDKSSYDAVIKLPKAGTWRVRAKHRDGNHALTFSGATKIKVVDWPGKYDDRRNFRFASPEKMVAITIDDGPNGRTMDFCRVLEKYGGRGTFFWTGSRLRHGYREQAKRVYARGHEIANHTDHHKTLTGSYSGCYSEVIVPKRLIRDYTGFSPMWVRAMGGSVGSAGVRAVNDSGQLYCNWSIDSYDAHGLSLSSGEVYDNVMRGVKPGSVILIHQTHSESLEALPRICRELKRRGYEIVTLSDLAARSEPYSRDGGPWYRRTTFRRVD